MRPLTLLLSSSRSTLNGRMFVACTIGSRPKISAVSETNNYSADDHAGIQHKGYIGAKVFQQAADEVTHAYRGGGPDNAADQSEQTRFHTKEEVEILAMIASRFEHSNLCLPAREYTCIVLMMPTPPINSASRPAIFRNVLIMSIEDCSDVEYIRSCLRADERKLIIDRLEQPCSCEPGLLL